MLTNGSSENISAISSKEYSRISLICSYTYSIGKCWWAYYGNGFNGWKIKPTKFGDIISIYGGFN